MSRISKAFNEVTSLTQAIELNAGRYFDGDANDGSAIDILHDAIIYQEDSPDGRGDAADAREALGALQAAVGALIANLRNV